MNRPGSAEFMGALDLVESVDVLECDILEDVERSFLSPHTDRGGLERFRRQQGMAWLHGVELVSAALM
ncbi:MAG: hypothetical protein GX837_11565 [Methanomicrobiales archaeon]|jgi:hypothetical protein|nr:hypothetical protein [Methanomicrobiales archaeon]